VILSLKTEDGFEVAFGVSSDACHALGWALQDEAKKLKPENEFDSAETHRLNQLEFSASFGLFHPFLVVCRFLDSLSLKN
jgi:hypothetical protein